MNASPNRGRVKLAAALIYLVGWAVLVIVLARNDAARLSAEPMVGSITARVPHVFVVMMENEESSALVGNRSAPYLNRLIKQYGYAANYDGVTHPSLPNYVASIAGDFYDAYNDWHGNRFNAVNIVDQLEAKNLTWKAYMEDLPRPGYNGDVYPHSGPALYVRKHDPFMLMNDIIHNHGRLQRVVPTTELADDLRNDTVPNLAYISPNLCHDMHGITGSHSPCPPNRTQLIRTGDRYLASLVPQIMRSPAWTGDSAIFITFDEGDSLLGCCRGPRGDGGGRVVTVVIARQGVRHYWSDVPYNHYALLKTLQYVWHLGCLSKTCYGVVRPMTEFLFPGRSGRVGESGHTTPSISHPVNLPERKPRRRTTRSRCCLRIQGEAVLTPPGEAPRQ